MFSGKSPLKLYGNIFLNKQRIQKSERLINIIETKPDFLQTIFDITTPLW